jgi:hypothetical protein
MQEKNYNYVKIVLPSYRFIRQLRASKKTLTINLVKKYEIYTKKNYTI